MMNPMVRVAEQPQDLHLITHPALCAPLNVPLAVLSLVPVSVIPSTGAVELTLVPSQLLGLSG